MLRIGRKEFDVFLSSCRRKGPISLVHFINMPRDDITGFTYYLIRISFDIFCRSRRENINITHFIRCEGSYTTLVFYYSRSHYWCPDVHIDVIYNFLRKKFDTYDLFLSRVFWSRTIASSKIQKFTVAQRWYIKESMILQFLRISYGEPWNESFSELWSEPIHRFYSGSKFVFSLSSRNDEWINIGHPLFYRSTNVI